MTLQTPSHRIPLFVALLTGTLLLAGCGKDDAASAPAAAKPALTVEAVVPASAEWPLTLAANGDIAAWQEAVIGAEVSGYRLAEVRVNVGDRVKKGQVLARIDNGTVAAELAQTRAAVAEAEAAVTEAAANAERARRLQEAGFYSHQTGSQFMTGEQTARARLAAARAKARADEIRLAQTQVVAPDDGIISARAATAGSLTQPGQELFRLIRGGRLEWRAKVAEADLGRIAPGTVASLTLPGGAELRGKVRAVAPSVDAASRDGLVYVDIPTGSGEAARAGMFARGVFELGRGSALTLPQSAVVVRDGFAYVYRLGALDKSGLGKVAQTKVELGRRVGDRVEVVAGLPADAQVVAAGAGFLADGDTVKVVAATPAGVKKAAE
ncbi:MAG: efflux RND transporter periplasmic adaptor subunit [Gallionellaceae bacterium]|nr:efflux RND transporter periplasmic adaptor subunit [Gallionellaceae bacterium]